MASHCTFYMPFFRERAFKNEMSAVLSFYFCYHYHFVKSKKRQHATQNYSVMQLSIIVDFVSKSLKGL